MSVFARSSYLNHLRKFRDTNRIKVVSGVRRCGKSSLLALLRDHLRSESVDDAQVIDVNFDDFEAQPLRDPAVLLAFLKERLLQDGITYIFFDEIQEVKGFEKVIDSLQALTNVDIYITASSGLHSAEDNALLTESCVELPMFPLSFKEFIDARGGRESLAVQYRRYLKTSSFPFAIKLAGDEAIQAYLEGLGCTILLKDAMCRPSIADGGLLQLIAALLTEMTGTLLSPHRIAELLAESGRKVDVKTADKYVKALCSSHLFYEARRYDIKQKRELPRLSKFYAVDTALCCEMFGPRCSDEGRILENVVYLEFLRRGYIVFVGKIGDFEVDFVARKHDETLYVQVAATVRDEQTLARELRPLQMIKDNHHKIILTLDEDLVMDYEGIERMNALEWLVG